MGDATGDLERILDDALDDFDASLHAAPSALPAHSEAQSSKDGNAASTSQGPPTTDASAQAATNVKAKKPFNPLGTKPRKRPSQQPVTSEPVPEQFQASLDGLAAAMEQIMKGDSDAPVSTDNVQATLQQVNEAARVAAEGSTGHGHGDSSAGDGDGQAEIQQMLDAMSHAMEGGGGEADSFVETLMHGLLSKEVLYDPLKDPLVQDISGRFPAWIEANRDKLTPDELAQYEKQLEHINLVCDLLEQHGDTKFDELLQLLQELQAMGQPPQELLQQMQASTGATDSSTGLPEDLPQCPIQ